MAVRSLTQSKELVTSLNHHGICVSYNTVKQIDVDLAEQIVTTAGDNGVSLPPVYETTSLLNGATDNFDSNESTLVGIGSTHDTILALFQNVSGNLEKPSLKDPFKVEPQYIQFQSKVRCQQLVRIGTVKECGEIPTEYNLSEVPSDYTALALASEAVLPSLTTESLAASPVIITTTEPTPNIVNSMTTVTEVPDTTPRDHFSIIMDIFQLWTVYYSVLHITI